MKKNILIFVLFFLTILEGYFLLKLRGATENRKDEVMTIVESDKTPDFSYCTSGHCPAFYSMDITKGETQNYTIVRQPTHMTKGAGQIWVINEFQGVLFKSEIYANVGVEESLEKDGFYITYTTGDNYDVLKIDRVKFIDGAFEVIEDVDINLSQRWADKK
jgi:hypothetical protein